MPSYVLSDEEQEAVERGEAARFLLDDPQFLLAIESVRTECAETILTSAPLDKEAREDAYQLSRGLSAVTEALLKLAQLAESITAQAETTTDEDLDHLSDVDHSPDY